MKYCSLLFALLVSSGLTAQTPADPGELRLQPGDMMRLQVGREPHLSGEYPVTEEGVALLPIIGLVEVRGRRFADVRAEVRRRYAVELREAEVLVTPVLRIAVLGEVRGPGLLPVDPTLTVADVIAAAGGLTPRGDPGKVTLVRNGQPTRISLETGAEGRDRPLQSGDQIVVGRQSWVRENLNVLLTAGASVVAAAITSLILR